MAVRQTEDAAAAIADQLRSTRVLAEEPEAKEDRSFSGVPKLYDTVMLSNDAQDRYGPLRNGVRGLRDGKWMTLVGLRHEGVLSKSPEHDVDMDEWDGSH